MVRKTLIDMLFPSKVGLVLPSEEVNGRIEEVKNDKYVGLNSKTFVEYIISGTNISDKIGTFNTYIEENFKETYKPTAGDIVIIRKAGPSQEIRFEGIISKQEGREREVMYKSGTGPYATIENITLKEARKGYERKGTYMQFYSPIKKENPKPVEETEMYTPVKKMVESYLPATVKVNVA